MYAVFFVLRVIFLRVVDVVLLRGFREPPLPVPVPVPVPVPDEAVEATWGALNIPNKFDHPQLLAGGGGGGELVLGVVRGGETLSGIS